MSKTSSFWKMFNKNKIEGSGLTLTLKFNEFVTIGESQVHCVAIGHKQIMIKIIANKEIKISRNQYKGEEVETND